MICNSLRNIHILHFTGLLSTFIFFAHSTNGEIAGPENDFNPDKHSYFSDELIKINLLSNHDSKMSNPAPNCPKNTRNIPHQYDCSRFYQCISGIPYLRECPIKLHFNPELEICDWPKNAGCMKLVTSVTEERSCDLSEPPPKCPDHNQTESVELLNHPYYCGQFYRCYLGAPFLFNCQTGLYYDDNLKACVSKEFTVCECEGEQTVNIKIESTRIVEDKKTCDLSASIPACPGLSNGTAILLPHQYNCSQFYICHFGQLYLNDCPKGLFFDEKLMSCISKEFARCTCDKEPKSVSFVKMRSCNSSASPPNCPKQSNGPAIQLSHEFNCSQFYMCYCGEPYLFDCPIGMYFDTIQKTCELKRYVKCECDKETKMTTIQPTTTVVAKERSCNSNVIPPECPKRDPSKLAIRLPHPSNCSQFYNCDWGVPYLINCSAGLHFSIDLELCVSPEIARCKCYNEAITEHSVLSATKSRIRFCDPPSPPPKCQQSIDPNKITISWPDPSNCSQFYMCNRNESLLFACSLGYHFSPKLKICMPAKDAECVCIKDTIKTTTQPSCYVPPKCPENCPEDLKFPDPCDCSRFYQCIDDQPVLRICPNGLHFDSRWKVCDLPAYAGCT